MLRWRFCIYTARQLSCVTTSLGAALSHSPRRTPRTRNPGGRLRCRAASLLPIGPTSHAHDARRLQSADRSEALLALHNPSRPGVPLFLETLLATLFPPDHGAFLRRFVRFIISFPGFGTPHPDPLHRGVRQRWPVVSTYSFGWSPSNTFSATKVHVLLVVFVE